MYEYSLVAIAVLIVIYLITLRILKVLLISKFMLLSESYVANCRIMVRNLNPHEDKLKRLEHELREMSLFTYVCMFFSLPGSEELQLDLDNVYKHVNQANELLAQYDSYEGDLGNGLCRYYIGLCKAYKKSMTDQALKLRYNYITCKKLKIEEE